MQTITFTCETITPMFLCGADGTPELRAPSIKGALRFWWRAMHGNLDLKELKEREGEIFGDTKKRSKVIIVVDEAPTSTLRTSLLPHKGGSESLAFAQKQTFTITLRLCQVQGFTLDKLKWLFIVTSILGGLGKRSRRGFGSFQITEIDGEPFTMEIVNGNTIIHIIQKEINSSFNLRSKDEYPTIQKIEISTVPKSVKDIGTATHDTMGENAKGYKDSLGSGTPRFASPVYLSILPNNRCIATTLNTVHKSNFDPSLQRSLLSKILK